MDKESLESRISNTGLIDFHKIAFEILEEISNNPDLLIEMLRNVMKSDYLLDKCESYDFLDKYVLVYGDAGSIRLSYFNGRYANRIHYHRWDYSAYILQGGYRQYIYGTLPDYSYNIKNLYPYKPLIIQDLKKRDFYTLDHKVIHSVEVIPNSLSISVRGPAQIDKFQVIDALNDTSWWQYGEALEADEERDMKKINRTYLNRKVEDMIHYIKEL